MSAHENDMSVHENGMSVSKSERLRAPFQYFGGKGNMLAKLLPLLPSHKVYVEPFCGAASLFFAKQPSPVEVLNDLNEDVVNVFRVLQNKETHEELRFRLMHTPYARSEFVRAIEMLKQKDLTPVDRAWAFMVRQNMGFSGNIRASGGTWSRAFISNQGFADTCNKWLMRLSMLDAWRWRLMTVQIDCRDALEVICYWDSPDTLFYVDPPYVTETRKTLGAYAHEMTAEQHEALVELLLGIKGKAVVSGYEHSLHSPFAQAGWKVHKFHTACYAAGRIRTNGLQGKGSASAKVPRTEVVWVKE
jgi:DNA adenine methylase